MGSEIGKGKSRYKNAKQFPELCSVNTFIIISKQMSMRELDGVSWKSLVRTFFRHKDYGVSYDTSGTSERDISCYKIRFL